jgi:hypothetical protein
VDREHNESRANKTQTQNEGNLFSIELKNDENKPAPERSPASPLDVLLNAYFEDPERWDGMA